MDKTCTDMQMKNGCAVRTRIVSGAAVTRCAEWNICTRPCAQKFNERVGRVTFAENQRLRKQCEVELCGLRPDPAWCK